MKKTNALYIISGFALVFSLFVLTSCSKEHNHLTNEQPAKITTLEETVQIETPPVDETQRATETITDKVQSETTEPIIEEVDLSSYFDGINGAAVIYDPSESCYQIYNQELALTRRSPCSTFKIISSLIALENGIVEPDNSTRTWSGKIFWNEEWNKDIDFSDAFHASCVWYFREVIDEIGADSIREELNKLQYGNCDISDWTGALNTNNNNPALTGFWIESSLLISPKEQVEVMERIFGDSADKRIYFCVYLGETDGKEVSSAKAREINIKIVSDYSYFLNK